MGARGSGFAKPLVHGAGDPVLRRCTGSSSAWIVRCETGCSHSALRGRTAALRRYVRVLRCALAADGRLCERARRDGHKADGEYDETQGGVTVDYQVPHKVPTVDLSRDWGCITLTVHSARWVICGCGA